MGYKKLSTPISWQKNQILLSSKYVGGKYSLYKRTGILGAQKLACERRNNLKVEISKNRWNLLVPTILASLTKKIIRKTIIFCCISRNGKNAYFDVENKWKIAFKLWYLRIDLSFCRKILTHIQYFSFIVFSEKEIL